MEQIIITHRNGSTLKLNSKENVSAVTKALQTVELLGADVIDISVQSAKKMNFLLGDKITVIGRDYTLNTPARERKISENNFQYDMQFEGVQYDLLRAAFNVNIDTTSNDIQDISGDSITGDIKLFLDVLVANANRVFGAGKWAVGTYPAGTKTLTLSFNDSDNCLTVLQSLCGEDSFGTEFKIAIDGSGNRTINVGTIGNSFGHTFEYGKGKGIYELTREKLSSSNIITRLNCFGGSKNIITPKYRASKLCLATKSKSQSFIEDAGAIATYGIWESTRDFDDIYPHRTGIISSLGATVFEFIDSSMDFDLNEKNVDGTTKYLMDGTSAKIHFNTGNLAGYEFEVTAYVHATKKFTIISQTDQNDYVFPSTTTAAFQFQVGDEYIISDIYMPQSYIDTAEAELAVKGAAYLAKYSQPLVQYGLTIDSNYLKTQVGADALSNIVWVGDFIPIKDTDLEVDKTIRVKGFTRDLMLDYAYQLTIADLSVTVSTINRVISGMNTIDKVIKINDLNDPAKARRNWKDSQEVLNMIFDVEGDYYTDKIKPLSIETNMLSVGAKSMQFGLEAIIFQPNYAANKNRVVYSGGSLVHYSILDSGDNPIVWTITGGDVVITTDTARYVYAKCSRSGSGGSILFSTDKISVESDGAYYHFLIGILNSVDANNTRALALMYGFTTVNGRFIKTGRIQSADGNTYFDLDAGEFKGNFKFSSGETIQTAISNSVNNIQIGGRNYITESEAEKEFSSTLEIPLSMFVAGETISLSFFGKYATGGTESWSFLVKNTGTGTSGTNLLYIPVNENSYTYKSATITLPATLDNLRIVCSNAGAYAYHGFLKLIKVEKGNKVTDWTAAPEDVDANIALTDYLKAAMQANTSIEGGLLSTTLIQVKDVAGNVTGGLSGLATDNVVLFGGGTYADALASATTPTAVAVIDRKDGSGHRAKGSLLWDKLGNLTVGLFKVVAGAITGFEGLYERIRITTQAITPLATLIAGGWIREATDYRVTTIYAGTVYNSYSDIPLVVPVTIVRSAVLSIPIATSIKIYAGGILGYLISDTSGVTINTINQKFEISGVGSYTLSPGGNQTIALAAGSYTITYIIEGTFNVTKFHSAMISMSNTSAAYVEVQSVAPSRTEIGGDGFFSFWSTTQYLFYDKLNGLKIKGATDIPGILATGSISSAGTHTNRWGAKSSASNATYTATGIYDVIHSVGVSTYTVILTPSVDGYRASIISKSTTSFRVQVRNSSNTIIAGSFDYTILGVN
jgi:hypothetical protein